MSMVLVPPAVSSIGGAAGLKCGAAEPFPGTRMDGHRGGPVSVAHLVGDRMRVGQCRHHDRAVDDLSTGRVRMRG